MQAEVGILTLPADSTGGDIAAHTRVFMSSGKLAVAGLTDNDFVGTMNERYISAGVGKSDVGQVLPRNAPGSHYMIANGAVTLHATVWTAASGKISSTGAATSIPIGIALDAATADGDIIRVLPFGGYPAEHA